MKVTVIFPKACCFDGKDNETQRVYRNKINHYLNLMKDAGCKFEYFLEDKLARDFLSSVGVTDATVISCVSKSDIEFFNNYRELVNLDDKVYENFVNVENKSGDVEKKLTVPISLIRENRDEYIDKRVSTFYKRLKTSTDAYLTRCKNVCMFRTDNGLDIAKPLRETVVIGDGRLCIEININSNMAVSYYGGTFIQEEYLPTLLSM